MDCADVRELLPEHALGVLQPAGLREVSPHLGWCAACRKEAAELAEGAAVAGLAAAAQPAPQLENRVVAAVGSAARRRGSRRGAGAVAIAAAVAVLALGLAGAMAGRVRRLEAVAADARHRAERTAVQFESVLEDLGAEGSVRSTSLTPSSGDAGGRAILFQGREGRDFAVVIVGGLPESGAPYRAYLVSSSGRRMVIGRLERTADGQLSRYRFFAHLGGSRDVVVVGRDGRTVLTGSLLGAPD